MSQVGEERHHRSEPLNLEPTYREPVFELRNVENSGPFDNHSNHRYNLLLTIVQVQRCISSPSTRNSSSCKSHEYSVDLDWPSGVINPHLEDTACPNSN